MKDRGKQSDELEELVVAKALSQLKDSSEDKEKQPIATSTVRLPDANINTEHRSTYNTGDSTLSPPPYYPSEAVNRKVAADRIETETSVRAETPDDTQEPQHQQPWRNMLLTATSLVLTKETRRKFRKLLSVLKLASEHLNGKVKALKEAMELEASQDNVTPKLSSVAIRNDIILTIKKCLAMLSTLATNSLPSAASEKVRNTILKLPSQWANQVGESSTFSGIDGKSESAVLALATETLVSIRKITNVLSETLERADSWVERLPSFIGKRMRDDVQDKAPPIDPVEPPTKAIKKESIN